MTPRWRANSPTLIVVDWSGMSIMLIWLSCWLDPSHRTPVFVGFCFSVLDDIQVRTACVKSRRTARVRFTSLTQFLAALNLQPVATRFRYVNKKAALLQGNRSIPRVIQFSISGTSYSTCIFRVIPLERIDASVLSSSEDRRLIFWNYQKITMI